MPNSFDPDAYLAQKAPAGGFDPDAYLAAKSSPGASQGLSFGQAASGAANLLSGGEYGSVPPGSPEQTERFNTAKKYLSNTPLMRALDAGAMAGKYVRGKANDLAGYVAEKGGQYGYPKTGAAIGTAIGTVADATMPTDRLSTAATLVGIAPGEAAEAKAAYNIPTKAQRVIGEIAGTQSGVKPAHLAAVIANPEIMSDATPSMREVGKEYQAAFKSLGMKFDAAQYQEITGMRYAPNDTQTSKLSGILGDAATKLETDPSTLSPSEAFLARSAGKKALDGPISPAAKKQMAADVAALDTYLENNGVPEIKALGQKYFRAAAKESLENIIPRNKQGNPAVVRSLLMAHYGKEALSALAEGKPVKAAIAAGSGAMMSPKVQGSLIPFLAGKTSPLAERAAVIGAGQTPAALRALQQSRDENGQQN